MTTRDSFRFFHRLRVRWAEVDMQKIVFNAHYLTYFDTAITAYWRALALPYQESMHLLEGDLYLKKAGVEYHASAELDDQIDVAMKCARIGNSSMRVEGAIFRGEKLLISGELVYVFADPATQTSRPVPARLREVLLGYEAGEDVLEVRTGDWATLGKDASHIRTEVFVREQGIPAELEWDEADAQAVHAVAYNRLGQVVATGRLLRDGDGTGRIGRVAVHKVLRGGGVGVRLMQALADAAHARGDSRLVLSAQRTAHGFYKRLGFVDQGEPFMEVGIPHQDMVATLPLGR